MNCGVFWSGNANAPVCRNRPGQGPGSKLCETKWNAKHTRRSCILNPKRFVQPIASEKGFLGLNVLPIRSKALRWGQRRSRWYRNNLPRWPTVKKGHQKLVPYFVPGAEMTSSAARAILALPQKTALLDPELIDDHYETISGDLFVDNSHPKAAIDRYKSQLAQLDAARAFLLAHNQPQRRRIVKRGGAVPVAPAVPPVVVVQPPVIPVAPQAALVLPAPPPARQLVPRFVAGRFVKANMKSSVAREILALPPNTPLDPGTIDDHYETISGDLFMDDYQSQADIERYHRQLAQLDAARDFLLARLQQAVPARQSALLVPQFMPINTFNPNGVTDAQARAILAISPTERITIELLDDHADRILDQVSVDERTASRAELDEFKAQRMQLNEAHRKLLMRLGREESLERAAIAKKQNKKKKQSKSKK